MVDIGIDWGGILFGVYLIFPWELAALGVGYIYEQTIHILYENME